MATITFNIDDTKLARVRDGVLVVYPNNEKDPDDNPLYTDNQWLREIIRRFVAQTVRRGEAALAQQAANAGLTETDSLVT